MYGDIQCGSADLCAAAWFVITRTSTWKITVEQKNYTNNYELSTGVFYEQEIIPHT